MDKIPQICLGCGAALHGPVCEFCGREYDLETKYQVQDDIYYSQYVDVTFMGKKLKTYVGNVELEPIYSEAYRTFDGTLHTVKLRDPIIRLTLISV